MDKDKSILEKITGTMKDIANIREGSVPPRNGRRGQARRDPKRLVIASEATHEIMISDEY
jgi:hypothetical protein